MAFELPGIEIRLAGRRRSDTNAINAAEEGRVFLRPREGTQFEAPLDADPDLLARILGFDLIERDFGMNELTLQLDNRDLRLFGDVAYSGGRLDLFHNAVWLVRIGWPTDGVWSRQYAFVVKQITGFRTLQVRAYEDSHMRLDSTAKHRTFRSRGGAGVRRSSVARAIAKEHGLAVPLGGILESDGTFPKIIQPGITDAAMLTKLAKMLGYIWWIDLPRSPRANAFFYFRPREFGESAYRPGHDYHVGRDQAVIRDLAVETDIFRIPRTALTVAIDPFEGVVETYKAGNRTTERQVSGSETPLDPSVPAASAEAGQDPTEADVIWSSSGSGLPTRDRLEEDLDGLWKTLEANMIQVRLAVLGDPAVAPRRVNFIDGIGQLSGAYYIKEARHSYKQGGVYESELLLLMNAFARGDLRRAQSDIIAAVENATNPQAVPEDEGTGAPTQGVAVTRQRLGDSPDAETVATPELDAGHASEDFGGEGHDELEDAVASD